MLRSMARKTLGSMGKLVRRSCGVRVGRRGEVLEAGAGGGEDDVAEEEAEVPVVEREGRALRVVVVVGAPPPPPVPVPVPAPAPAPGTTPDARLAHNKASDNAASDCNRCCSA